MSLTINKRVPTYNVYAKLAFLLTVLVRQWESLHDHCLTDMLISVTYIFNDRDGDCLIQQVDSGKLDRSRCDRVMVKDETGESASFTCVLLEHFHLRSHSHCRCRCIPLALSPNVTISTANLLCLHSSIFYSFSKHIQFRNFDAFYGLYNTLPLVQEF